jgi:hypothetical protein
MKTAPLVASLLIGANATLTPAQITQVTEGFVGAALHYEKLDGYKACYLDDNVKPVTDIEQGMADLDKAIEAKDISGVYKAAMELKSGFSSILIDQKDCVAKTQDPAHLAKIEAYMKQYETMDTLYSHVESDLAWNGISIATKLSDAKKQYAAGNFNAYGADYGTIIDEVLIGTNNIKAKAMLGQEGHGQKKHHFGEKGHGQRKHMLGERGHGQKKHHFGEKGHGQRKHMLGEEGHGQRQEVPVALKETAQVIEGILIGALKAEGLTSIQDCIKDGTTIFHDVQDGITLLKKGDAADELAGLKKIGAGVVEIKSALVDCKDIVADFETLGKMAAVYSNPWSFAYHVGKDLIVNGVTIYKDTEAAVTAFEAGSFEPMGEDIGNALAKLLIGGAVDSQEKWEAKQADSLNLF